MKVQTLRFSISACQLLSQHRKFKKHKTLVEQILNQVVSLLKLKFTQAFLRFEDFLNCAEVVVSSVISSPPVLGNFVETGGGEVVLEILDQGVDKYFSKSFESLALEQADLSVLKKHIGKVYENHSSDPNIRLTLYSRLFQILELTSYSHKHFANMLNCESNLARLQNIT